MSIIYEPKGKAEEYSPLAANLYTGCDHGCIYCFIPYCNNISREQFKKAKPKTSVINYLEKEAPRYKGNECLLSFTCDPYQVCDQTTGITREAIEIMLHNGIIVNILTKGGKRSARDFDLLEIAAKTGQVKYGVTLTFTDEKVSRYYEPNAAKPHERIACLRQAKERGIPTWISFEPVIEPQQVIELIKQTYQFVDLYKIGKWNYSKESKNIDWVLFAKETVYLLDSLGKKYYLKNDLREILGKAGIFSANFDFSQKAQT
jgi:DNA repair photolyase